jgi:chromosome segregation ATPase
MPMGELMCRLCVLFIFIMSSGCLTPITSRFDQLNDQLACSRQQLDALHAQLVQANQRVAHLEAEVVEANGRLRSVEGKLSQTNEKLDIANGRLANVERATKTVEDAAKKITGGTQ